MYAKLAIFAISASLPLMAARCEAAPITFVYEGSWQSFYSAPFGPNYRATLVLDNGGTSSANQTFTQSHFVSGRLESGTYDTSIDPSHIVNWHFDFVTDGNGQIQGGWFEARVNGDYWDFDNHFFVERFVSAVGSQAGYFNDHIGNPGPMPIPPPIPPPMPVPEPFSIFIWSALFGVGAIGRRLGFVGNGSR